MFRITAVLLLSASSSFAQIVIAYGDMRFTDPAETQATNPRVRKWLVDKIAAERPKAVLISGDVPYRGGIAADYAQFHAESAPWRALHVQIIPALGNHEFRGDEQQCLENWWNEFPKLRGRRWYASKIDRRIVVLNLDSNSSLLPESQQATWIAGQLGSLPRSVKFVFFNLHHPPVADVETGEGASHNARPNEIALATALAAAPERTRMRFIVNAGHVHNYERFDRDGIIYLVSGGGGAAPVPITRGPDDLYQDKSYPNYHYLKFVLHESRLDAEMIRVADPSSAEPRWEVKDRFQVTAP